MAIPTKHPARSLLNPIGADRLRQAVERLRANGLSDVEAAAEMIRKNFYDFLDSEIDAQSERIPRLRIVKRS
jgi:hypothetical protein